MVLRSTTPTGGGSLWATLGADPICRVTVLVLSLLAIPYLVPLLPRETLGAISADYFDIVLLALPLVALLYRLQRITHPEEHRFWRHLAAGIGFWIAARVFYVVWPGYEQSVPAAIVADVLILLFYMFTVQATETRPHQPPGWSASAPGYRLASTGAVAFASPATSRARLERAALVAHLGVPPGDYVVLTVRDTGTGMEPATLTRVFEPFFTTKTAGPDTGLGLSAVVDIVRQASGAVEVESTPGHGSTFTVWLPEATPAPEPVLPRAGFEATHRLERESLGAG